MAIDVVDEVLLDRLASVLMGGVEGNGLVVEVAGPFIAGNVGEVVGGDVGLVGVDLVGTVPRTTVLLGDLGAGVQISLYLLSQEFAS